MVNWVQSLTHSQYVMIIAMYYYIISPLLLLALPIPRSLLFDLLLTSIQEDHKHSRISLYLVAVAFLQQRSRPIFEDSSINRLLTDRIRFPPCKGAASARRRQLLQLLFYPFILFCHERAAMVDGVYSLNFFIQCPHPHFTIPHKTKQKERVIIQE